MSYSGPAWLTTIVNAISSDLTSRGMSYAGLDPLSPNQDGTPGKIYFGPQYVEEQGAPNCVVCEVVMGDFGPRDPDLVCINGIEDADFLSAWSARPLATIAPWFRFHCWASASTQSGETSTPEADFDALIALTKAVLRSVLQIIPGDDARSQFAFTNSTQPNAVTLDRTGWKSTFMVRVPMPIEDYSLNYVPAGTTPLFVLPQT